MEVADLDNHTKQADGRCLSNTFFFGALFCCWSHKILLTFLQSLFLVRRYFTSVYFLVVLRIVPGIMGLYAVFCCNYTVSLHCIVRLRFKMNILCNNITSLVGM